MEKGDYEDELAKLVQQNGGSLSPEASMDDILKALGAVTISAMAVPTFLRPVFEKYGAAKGFWLSAQLNQVFNHMRQDPKIAVSASFEPKVRLDVISKDALGDPILALLTLVTTSLVLSKHLREKLAASMTQDQVDLLYEGISRLARVIHEDDETLKTLRVQKEGQTCQPSK